MSFIEKMVKIKNRYVEKYDIYGRHIIDGWAGGYAATHGTFDVLDIGCGSGADLLRIKTIIPGSTLTGIDVTDENVKSLSRAKINAFVVNLESEKLPFPDEKFDLVLSNQVFEHLKNWVWVLMEIGRVLKPGGKLIVGVPNLASFHNRVLLAMGKQPSCIHLDGMHVRGFTFEGIQGVLEHEGIFRINRIAGTGFYPLPPSLSRVTARLFPKASVCIYLECEKTGDHAKYRLLEPLRKRGELKI